jgi:hypothetical protein
MLKWEATMNSKHQPSDNNAEGRQLWIPSMTHLRTQNWEVIQAWHIRELQKWVISWIPSIKHLRIHQQSKYKRWSKSFHHLATLTPKLIQKTTRQETEAWNLCIQWQIQTMRYTWWIHNWKQDLCNQNRTFAKAFWQTLTKDFAVWLILTYRS